MGKHIAVYVRVSKRSQDEASQMPDLERWARAQDPGTEIKWYRDKFTGKTMDRKGWNRLETAFREGKVSSVVVWRLDRLGRTAKGLTALFEELVERRVDFVSIKDGLDLATPAGRLMANVLASVAQYETEVRAERIYTGLEVAKANGVRLGRKPVGQGKGKRIRVTPEQEQQVHKLKAEETPVTAIARATGLSRPTIYSILQAD